MARSKGTWGTVREVPRKGSGRYQASYVHGGIWGVEKNAGSASRLRRRSTPEATPMRGWTASAGSLTGTTGRHPPSGFARLTPNTSRTSRCGGSPS